ncbi:hypothetical protein GCM10009850_094260 [Nonomuraea monospora]|uniref:Uncharacterized protein n=1 Tax=Nonomuraea monospora TaxID=568818 RepID=A0ABN3CX00_9ACTN
MRIVTHLWAVAGRYRCGRPAAVVAALYLTAVIAATGYAVVSRDLVALSIAATGMKAWPVILHGSWLGPMLVAIGWLNAWMVWQVLRGPALPRLAGLPGGVVWLRRLLYLGIAGDLLIWELVEDLPDVAEIVVSRVLWAATMVLWVRVLSGVRARFRVIALALGLIGSLPLSLFFQVTPAALWVLGLASIAFTVTILLGQRRDGRWSAATVTIGWVALVAPLLLIALNVVLPSGSGIVSDALDALSTVWLARTAHELAQPGRTVHRRRAWRTRSLLPVALLLPLLAVGAEEDARHSFTGAEEDCAGRLRPYAGTRPQDRRATFLCLARDASSGTPMFPSDLPDQQVVAHGRRLCATPDVQKRHASLRRLGTDPTDTTQVGDALEFLCPGAAAQHRAQAAHAQRRREREQAAWRARLAEANARCADPWPQVRAVRQGTAAYQLFEGGGYYVHDDRDDTEGGPDGDVFEAIDDGFVHAAGSSAVIMTFGENEPMCLTVKAFRSAPPLRLKGWDRVVEVGIVSRGGHIGVPPYPEGGESGALGPLPDLAVDGPGRYRMRVHARAGERERGGSEEHLIVVYPGRSAKKVVHRQ